MNSMVENDEFTGFCSKCGAKIRQSTEYCSECGSPVNGTVPVADNVAYVSHERSNDHMLWIVILTGLYAVISILSGISALGAESLVSMVKDVDPVAWEQMLKSLRITEGEFISYMVGTGYASLVSGILAAVAALLSAKRVYWKVALGACVAGSLVVFITVAFTPSGFIVPSVLGAVIACAIGLLVSYMIYGSKSNYTS